VWSLQVAAFIRGIALAALVAALASAEDPVAALSRRIRQGAQQLAFDRPYGYLPALLDALHIPVESQMAVFSKTSIQSLRIEPSNPRVLYFNDSVAVGWVRGGFIELAAQDPGHGMQFYVLQQRPDERITRREDCLNCHQSAVTLLRSVMPAPDGVPSDETGVDSRTPFSRLWGGWFLTGATVPAPHMGNAVFANSQRHAITPSFDPKFSLTPSSDVVALMLFAHQMHMMNLLAHPDNIDDLVDALLFVDEPPWPGPMQGNSGFAEKFSAAGPLDHLGRGLRQFDLTRRLMRYPCSYMIYSDAFDALPADVKDSIYRRMWRILSGNSSDATGSRYQRLSRADREAVIGILRETKPNLPAWFGAVN
jgi:hypothetical protein